MKKSVAGLRFVVLCASGREHRLKTVGGRRRAQDLVTFYNVIVRPKCGPHRVGRAGKIRAGLRERRSP